MKLFAISLLAIAVISGSLGAAILTAKGRPPEWANWFWQVGPMEIHANRYAVWIYTERAGDLITTSLVFWPPRFQGDTMTAACRAYYDNERRQPYKSLEDRTPEEWAQQRAACGEQRRWFFPNYF